MREQNQMYEEDIKKLKEENESLEMIRKIKEKDAETEKATLEATVRFFMLSTKYINEPEWIRLIMCIV